MRSLMKIGFALLLLALALIGLAYTMLRAHGTTPVGSAEGRVVTSETRAVGANISAIDLSGPIDLTMRQGAVASLTVRGEQRLLANIDTMQDGAMLHIGIKGMLLHHRQPLQVTLILPSVSTINVRGSGDSTVNGFSGERIELQLDGSGNVKFNGRYRQVVVALHGSGNMEVNGGSSDRVEASVVGSGNLTVVGASAQFTLDQTGSGDVDAEHMTAQQATLSLQGSGGASITASDSANLTLRGSGDITVHGNPPQRAVSRTGSGDVDFL